MSVDISTVQRLTSPNPFALLSTQKPDGTTNLMAISWWTYVSNNPPMVAVCLSNKGYSGQLIREGHEFCLNIVAKSVQDGAFACGICSGRTVDKAEKFDIALTPSEQISPAFVQAHRAAMECRLNKIVELCDHTIYIGEVVATHCNRKEKQIFAFDGYARLNDLGYL